MRNSFKTIKDNIYIFNCNLSILKACFLCFSETCLSSVSKTNSSFFARWQQNAEKQVQNFL